MAFCGKDTRYRNIFKIDKASILSGFSSLEILENEKEILSLLQENIKNLDTAQTIKFGEDEKQVIKAFVELIKKKETDHNGLISKTSKVNDFVTRVEMNLREANSSLNTEGQEKAQSLETLQNKIVISSKIFKALRSLNQSVQAIDEYDFLHCEEIDLDSESKLCLEVHSEDVISDLIVEGIKNCYNSDLFSCLIKLLNNEISVKYYTNNEPDSLRKKTNSQLQNLYNLFDNPIDYLEYSDGTNSKSNSPGYNSEKYLQVILNNPSSKLVLIDQPEDNLGNKFISENLVDIFRELKFSKQLFLVTHNPAIVVYGDAESIILAKNENKQISYEQIKLEDDHSQREICRTLDGGEYIFDIRARKYNIEKLLIKDN